MTTNDPSDLPLDGDLTLDRDPSRPPAAAAAAGGRDGSRSRVRSPSSGRSLGSFVVIRLADYDVRLLAISRKAHYSLTVSTSRFAPRSSDLESPVVSDHRALSHPPGD